MPTTTSNPPSSSTTESTTTTTSSSTSDNQPNTVTPATEMAETVFTTDGRTDAQKEADALYEENIELEYAKREGGA